MEQFVGRQGKTRYTRDRRLLKVGEVEKQSGLFRDTLGQTDLLFCEQFTPGEELKPAWAAVLLMYAGE